MSACKEATQRAACTCLLRVRQSCRVSGANVLCPPLFPDPLGLPRLRLSSPPRSYPSHLPLLPCSLSLSPSPLAPVETSLPSLDEKEAVSTGACRAAEGTSSCLLNNRAR